MSMRGKTVNRTCRSCMVAFVARVADVKRGWAKFCSKRCKAVNQFKRTGYQWTARPFPEDCQDCEDYVITFDNTEFPTTAGIEQ